MKWFRMSIAASLAGLVLVSGQAFAGGSSRFAKAGKAYRPPARFSQRANQYQHPQLMQRATSRSANASNRQRSTTHPAGKPVRMGSSSKTRQLGVDRAATPPRGRQRSTAGQQPTPAGKALRSVPKGKLRDRPTVPNGSIRVPKRGRTQTKQARNRRRAVRPSRLAPTVNLDRKAQSPRMKRVTSISKGPSMSKWPWPMAEPMHGPIPRATST
jgi:hypothetical protein